MPGLDGDPRSAPASSEYFFCTTNQSSAARYANVLSGCVSVTVTVLPLAVTLSTEAHPAATAAVAAASTIRCPE